MNQRTSRRALRVVGSATAVSFAVALASCSGGSGGSGDDGGDIELTFQWWGNDERAALTEEAIDLFEQNNPGITVSGSFSTIDS